VVLTKLSRSSRPAKAVCFGFFKKLKNQIHVDPFGLEFTGAARLHRAAPGGMMGWAALLPPTRRISPAQPFSRLQHLHDILPANVEIARHFRVSKAVSDSYRVPQARPPFNRGVERLGHAVGFAVHGKSEAYVSGKRYLRNSFYNFPAIV
jgi:hypothetical protein